MSRQSSYGEGLADSILQKLINGESMRRICEAEHMPDRGTVIRWMDGNPDFAAKYARAREAQADAMDDLILETAEGTTPENAVASRVKIDAYKWRAAKLKPQVYGDKVQLADADGNKLPPAPQFIVQPVISVPRPDADE
ncbi:MAG: hypothetical protein ACREO8_10175 [Luteimonas sp.]